MAVRNRLLGVIAGANRVDLIVDALSTWVNATSACVPQWAIDEFWKGVVPVDPLYPAHWTILGESAIALEAAVMDPGACSFSEPRERFTNAELALRLADLIALTDAVYAPAAMSVPPKLHLSLATAICYLRDVAYNAQVHLGAAIEGTCDYMEVQVLGKVPDCRGDYFCLTDEGRSTEQYRDVDFPPNHLQFWDLSTPPLARKGDFLEKLSFRYSSRQPPMLTDASTAVYPLRTRRTIWVYHLPSATYYIRLTTHYLQPTPHSSPPLLRTTYD